MAERDEPNAQLFYHGTRADLKPGDLIAPGYAGNYADRSKNAYVYLTGTLEAAIWGAVISILVSWWSSPTNAEQLNQFDPGRFDLVGLVPVAYSLFAMALGIASGALLRRTIPALAVTLAGFAGVRVLVTLLLRPHYMSPVTAYYNVLRGFNPAGAFWKISQGVLAEAGSHSVDDLAEERDRLLLGLLALRTTAKY